jgi:hypothetical protein
MKYIGNKKALITNGGGGKAEAPPPPPPPAAAPPPPEESGPDPAMQAELEKQRALRYKAGTLNDTAVTGAGTSLEEGPKTLLGE